MRMPAVAFTSVRQKLFAGALLSTLVALLVACAALFAYDLHGYRASSSASLAIEAELLGNASAAAVQFDDRLVAAANLAFLRARPTVRVAAIYLPGGAIFASYARHSVPRSEIPAVPGPHGVTIEGGRIAVFHPIVVDGQVIGKIHLAEDLELDERIASYAAIALAVMLAALVVSAALSAAIQKSMTRPIARIAELAREVVERKDYSVRANRTTRDEIGTLVDAFNEMLAEIERRTRALEASAAEVAALNRDLERRVGDRTAELEESNLQLKAANQAKSSFLSMMSHEIRTPLNGVLGMLELLSLGKLDAQQRSTMRIVQDSGRSLLRIIDDILDFSKIEAGKIEVHPEVTSISRVVTSVAAVYSGNASSKGLVLKAHVDRRISPAVLVDPLRLQQILNNLVSNAIKFTSRGSVVIDAELAGRRDGNDLVKISVADTGIGISAEGQAALFQPFSQADSHVARTFGGTGLGLSIGQRLAGLMRGSIEIESRLGRGTTATVTLPLPVADPSLLPSEDAGAPRDVDTLVGARREPPSLAQAEAEGTLVLIVDDHPINRLLLARQVSVLGYAHEAVENGREALRRWESGRFGLVMTDCNMPEMDGYELARAIRSRERATGRGPIVIVACTANALAGEAQNCFAAGMDDYIAKPVDLAKLAAKLDRWLPLPRTSRSGAQAIDRRVLAQIAGDDPGLEQRVLAQFARVTLDDADVLRSAFEARDLSLLTQTAHRIKGASASVGAVALGELGARLEAAGRVGDWEAIATMREELHREAVRLGAYVDSLAPAALASREGSRR